MLLRADLEKHSHFQECRNAKKLIRCGKHCNSFMPNQTTTAEADDVAREPQEDEHAVHDLWEYPVIGRKFEKSHLPSGETKGENMIKKDDLERKHLRMREFAHAVRPVPDFLVVRLKTTSRLKNVH